MVTRNVGTVPTHESTVSSPSLSAATVIARAPSAPEPQVAPSTLETGKVLSGRPNPTTAKILHRIAKYFRIAFAVWSWTIPLSFFAYFIISGGLIRPQALEGSALMSYVRSIVLPVLKLAEDFFTIRPVYGGWNFMLAILATAAFLARHLVLLPIKKIEHIAHTRLLRATATGPQKVTRSAEERVASQRLKMLREYSEAKKYLFGEKRKLAFLSIDVVGSTKMKIGEDKLSIEHAFSEYKKFVERILKKNAIWKVAWTPDGIMCAFHNTEDAVKAGQDVLTGLPWFNDGIHQLKTPFNVRCGVNAGEVVFPEDKAMEEISDEVIDVAGHMQKYAAHGALWLSSDVLTELVEKSAFREITVQKVDGHTAWEWRADDLGDTAPRGACTPTEH